MLDLKQEVINIKDDNEKAEVERFLNLYKLTLDKDVDYTLVLRQRGEIVATCSKAGRVLKCFAVKEELRGEGVASLLVTSLIDVLFDQGIYHCFVFTKPESTKIFTSLNFKLLAMGEKAALLENGLYTIDRYIRSLRDKSGIIPGAAALVMNCNPFTLGHRYLIEKAAVENSQVVVFVVEEDKSLFPFIDRIELVKQGISHLDNVLVIPGGEYIISSATFPSYFIRERGEISKAFAQIDAEIFGKYFCRELGIKRRYIGMEPYCETTNCYNEILKTTLPKYGVEVVEIPRCIEGGKPISASSVRQLIKEGKLQEAAALIPLSTLNFLNTVRGKEIMERIKSSSAPH